MIVYFRDFNNIFNYKLGGKAVKYLVSSLNNTSLLIYKLFISYIRANDVSHYENTPEICINKYNHLFMFANKDEKKFLSTLGKEERSFLDKLLEIENDTTITSTIQEDIISYILKMTKSRGLKYTNKSNSNSNNTKNN